MFLTQAELIEMTGYQKHQAQQRWLDQEYAMTLREGWNGK